MGKSRLIAEFVRSARRRGLSVAFGECQSFGMNSSYFVWHEIWRRLLDIDEAATVADQRAHVERELAAIEPALTERTPLLDSVLGIEIPENELTATFDAKLRKASLEDLLATCLRHRAAAEPLVIVLEDCHWIDDLSRDLLEVLARAAASLPVLVIVAYRPADCSGRRAAPRADPVVRRDHPCPARRRRHDRAHPDEARPGGGRRRPAG